MNWVNRYLYWAWYSHDPAPPAPTKKQLVYGLDEYSQTKAVGVFDTHADGSVDYTELK